MKWNIKHLKTGIFAFVSLVCIANAFKIKQIDWLYEFISFLPYKIEELIGGFFAGIGYFLTFVIFPIGVLYGLIIYVVHLAFPILFWLLVGYIVEKIVIKRKKV